MKMIKIITDCIEKPEIRFNKKTKHWVITIKDREYVMDEFVDDFKNDPTLEELDKYLKKED